jgi:hypothetical protein
MENKIFSRSEVNALLPQLKEDLLTLQQLTMEFEDRYIRLQKKKAISKQSSGRSESGAEAFFEEESRIDFMKLEVDLQIENFARKGLLIKRIHPGLIDFPSVVDGEDVLICWKEGEEYVTHYHGWNDGIVGRKPLPDA